MSQDPHEPFDLNVLDMIEESSIGAVPYTPSYQQAIRRLYASHQVYASADHKGGHVTARSLAKLPHFFANNLDKLLDNSIIPTGLESNGNIFDRYVATLPATLREKADGYRLKVVGRIIHHRKHHGVHAPVIHDPLHSLFLLPGTGQHHGLPGNYLYGYLFDAPQPDGTIVWSVVLHDADDGTSTFDAATLPEAWEKVKETLASAPFALTELAALGFKAP